MEKKRKALCIASSTFMKGSKLIELPGCKLDLEQFCKTINNFEFDIVSILNCDFKRINKEIKEFIKSLKPNDTVLFYYSGHGVTVGGRMMLAAYDTDIDNLKESAFCINKYMNSVYKRKVQFNMVFLDCCRNQLPTHTKNLERRIHLKPIDNTFIAFGTSPYGFSEGYETTDGKNQMSVFTNRLIEGISTVDSNIVDVMMYVRKKVIEDTEGEQVPCDRSTLTEHFYFKN